MIIAQAAFPWCSDGVLVLLVLIEVNVRELLKSDFLNSKYLLKGLSERGEKNPARLKGPYFFGVSLRCFSPFSSHLSIPSFYCTFLENFPLFGYVLMKYLIQNQGKVFLISFCLTS